MTTFSQTSTFNDVNYINNSDHNAGIVSVFVMSSTIGFSVENQVSQTTSGASGYIVEITSTEFKVAQIGSVAFTTGEIYKTSDPATTATINSISTAEWGPINNTLQQLVNRTKYNLDQGTKYATTAAQGQIRIATSAEVLAGTATNLAVPPAYLAGIKPLAYFTAVGNYSGSMSIQRSFNVSSIVWRGVTGKFLLNFSSAMPVMTYAYVGGSSTDNTAQHWEIMEDHSSHVRTTTQFSLLVGQHSNSNFTPTNPPGYWFSGIFF